MAQPQTALPASVPFGESCVILDVRTGVEHSGMSLKQPHYHVPIGDLDAALFLKEKNISAARPVYILCRSGKRATMAAEAFIAAGHGNVHVVEGGIVACEAAGIPVRKNQIISLERQVRITAGLLVVSGVALGALISPWFYALPGFIGAGLVFAGVTDSCGMAFALAKAPWNKGVQTAETLPSAPSCTASACKTPGATSGDQDILMPPGITFYSSPDEKQTPVRTHALTKTGPAAGGCS